jgi:hypothetical protein
MSIFKKIKNKIMESFLQRLLSGWFQKLSPKVYNILVTVVAVIEGLTVVPEFVELIGSDVATWVIRIVGFLAVVLTGSTPGPNGEVAEPENEG